MPIEPRKEKMVGWFAPGLLLQTAAKAIISKLFGNYADKREMEAALDIRMDDADRQELEKLNSTYRDREDIWFDFISDTGDGFNSTYSIAVSVAAETLQVKNALGEQLDLPRGKLLIMGGDQIYPTPTMELYDRKFRIPFKAALPKKEADPDPPHMYAIPGNHDWYDGLGAFLKVFCQKRWIGNWATYQRRSYFALPLPHRHWLWATDVQLNTDIDEPQRQYFKEVTTRMNQDDKVILVTAEPSWIYKELYPGDQSYDRLKFFIQTYITEDKEAIIGKTFELVAVLTGDLHHYSHYYSHRGPRPLHYVGAGGGGAFLHLTHRLPERLKKIEVINKATSASPSPHAPHGKQRLREVDIRLAEVFPTKPESRRLLLGNLIFFIKNYQFSALMGFAYVVCFWLMQGSSYRSPTDNYRALIGRNGFARSMGDTLLALIHAPTCLLLLGLIMFGFYKFVDKQTGIKGIWIWGAFHALVQGACLLFSFWLVAAGHQLLFAGTGHRFLFDQLFFLLELFVAGFISGGLIMGIYLYLSNRIFGIHIDEASSALREEDYKCFLRMHLDKSGLKIYPIGIRKVTKKWKMEVDGEQVTFEGEMPKHELIGGRPIVIPAQ